MSKLKSYVFLVLLAASGCGWDDTGSGVPIPVILPVDFLSEVKYKNLIVEIKYVTGFQPTAIAVNNLQTFLQQRLNKSGGITVSQTPIPSPSKSFYEPADLINVENATRTQGTSGSTLALYIFFADADYSNAASNTKTISLAYGTTSIAVFEKTVRSYAGGIGQPTIADLESTVLLHALGHILGLVSNGTPMVAAHQDTANGKHCDDAACLMHYKAETNEIAPALIGGAIPSLTQTCLNDLAANGGK